MRAASGNRHGHGSRRERAVNSRTESSAEPFHVNQRTRKQEAQAVRRVVVGVTGSPGSLTALHRAAAEARVRDAELRVVLAWQSPGGELGSRNGLGPAAGRCAPRSRACGWRRGRPAPSTAGSPRGSARCRRARRSRGPL
ncbi:universal stress protein [Streptomyces sp. NPDC020858]|uniref:universal stress protein n=1 Tax=Streptomyces sp. NPDC020858 TaxID=3365097 RepID=UPI00378A4C68